MGKQPEGEISGPATAQRVLQILQVNAEAEAACQALVNAANTAGGTDNITVLVVGCG